MYERRCLENIRKLYHSSGKCDCQHQYKTIIEAAIISIPKVFNDNSPISPSPFVPVKKPSERKYLHQFLDGLYVKQKNAVHRFCAAKSKRKAIRASSMLWASTPKRHRHTKIIYRV